VDDAIQRDRLIKRKNSNFLFRFCFIIISHNLFNTFMMIVILGNTAVLAMDKYKIDSSEKKILDFVN
jgi:hypothetical protein